MLKPEACDCAPEEGGEERTILFVSHTCPNCRMAKTVLDNAGVEYDTVVADDNIDLVNKYGVNQAPTLVKVGPEGMHSYRGVSEIMGWIRK